MAQNTMSRQQQTSIGELGGRWKVLDWPSDQNKPNRRCIYLQKRRLKGGSTERGYRKGLEQQPGQSLDAVIASKGYATKMQYYSLYANFCFNPLAHSKSGWVQRKAALSWVIPHNLMEIPSNKSWKSERLSHTVLLHGRTVSDMQTCLLMNPVSRL